MLKKKILIVTGEVQLKKKNSSLGSSKDIAYRVARFEEMGFDVEFLAVPGRSDRRCRDMLKETPIQSFYCIWFEHSRWPRSLAFVKSQSSTRVVVRAHNAEGLHSIDRFRAFVATRKLGSFLAPKLLLALVKEIPVAFVRDFLSVYRSHRLLACNETEINRYWRHFPLARSVIMAVNTVTDVSGYPETNFHAYDVAFLGSALKTYFNDHAYALLEKEVAVMISRGMQIPKLVITGDFGIPTGILSESLGYLGVVSPSKLEEIVVQSKIILILSPFGRGIKTRIYESLSMGKMVVMHDRQRSQIPLDLRGFVYFWKGEPGTLFPFLATIRPRNTELQLAAVEKYKLNADSGLAHAIFS